MNDLDRIRILLLTGDGCIIVLLLIVLYFVMKIDRKQK